MYMNIKSCSVRRDEMIKWRISGEKEYEGVQLVSRSTAGVSDMRTLVQL